MTPKELVSKIDHLVMNYEHKYIPPETDPMNIIEELIQQAKEEWLFEFIGWYANKYEMKFTDEFKAGLVKMFLNIPEP